MENDCSLQSSEDDYWDIVNSIPELLRETKFFNPQMADSLLQFEHPCALQNLLDLSLKDQTRKERLKTKDILDICREIMKYSVKTCHPNFHNQLFGGVDPIGLFAGCITEVLHTSQYTYEVGPALTLIESTVIQKCLSIFGFPNGDGIFSPGGSISNMYAMLCARHALNPDIKTKGWCGIKPPVAFTSEDSHYSLNKAANWLGIGTENLILIKADDRGIMVAEKLEQAIAKSLADGKQPFFVNATAGTTLLGAFDDFHKLADICEKYKIWMHVDGCLGGAAIFSEKHKHLLNGIGRANSFAWNPHKSLGAPLQCSMFLTRENGILHDCNAAKAKYLFQQDKFYDMSYDTGDKSIQCSRKVDAFKFWLMFKVRGQSGFSQLINNTLQKTNLLAKLIEQHEGFRLIMPHFQYTNICFWYIPIRLRHMEETEQWWEQVFKIPPLIKEKMINELMITYAPIPTRNIGNFFRMNLSCHPPATEESIQCIIYIIDKYGKDL